MMMVNVSILILLEVPLQPVLCLVTYCLPSVSILILLEVPLQPTMGNAADLVLTCFNPYFTGSTTSTVRALAVFTNVYPVSILILLEVPLQHIRPIFSICLPLVSILILLEVPLQRMA